MEKPPACLFYWNDFVADTIEWEAAAVGAYVRLLASEWMNGSIPIDTKSLAWIAHLSHTEFERLWNESIRFKFVSIQDGRLINPRMEREREKQEAYRNQRVMAGRASGAARAKAAIDTSNERSTSVPTEGGTKTQREKTKTKEEIERERVKRREELEKIKDGFDRFWTEYPRKENKIRSEQGWNNLFLKTARSKRLALYKEIMAGLRQHRESPKWVKDDGEYIPLPSTFINGKRWRDEIKSAAELAKESQKKEREELERLEREAIEKRKKKER